MLTITPDPKATERVRPQLPAPEVCPYCQSEVRLIENKEIYGQPYGDWPYDYRCTSDICGAFVGVHKNTLVPLGTLADTQLRNSRRAAKTPFNKIWMDGLMTRSQAYRWLAKQMRLPEGACHFGWFDIEQCTHAQIICETYLEKQK